MAWLPAQRWPKKIPAFYEPRLRPTRPMCRTSFRERAMLIETLVTGFVVTFVLIVAEATSCWRKPSCSISTANRYITRHSPVRGSRRSVGSGSRTSCCSPLGARTRSSSSLIRRTSLTIQCMMAAPPIAANVHLIRGVTTSGA